MISSQIIIFDRLNSDSGPHPGCTEPRATSAKFTWPQHGPYLSYHALTRSQKIQMKKRFNLES